MVSLTRARQQQAQAPNNNASADIESQSSLVLKVTDAQAETNAVTTRGRAFRVVLLIATGLYIPLYVGALFGFGPLQVSLEESGAFASECDEGDELPCKAQSQMLLTVKLSAQLTVLSLPLLGQAMDRYGPEKMIHLLFWFGVVGFSLLTVSISQSIDVMLFPAFIFIGFLTSFGSMFMVQTGLVFPPGRSRNRTISCLTMLFDVGGLTYLGLKLIENRTSLDLTAVIGLYFGGFILIVGVAIHAWRNVKMNMEDFDDARRNDDEPKHSEEEHTCECSSLVKDAEDEQIDESYVLIAKRSPKEQLLSSQFISLAVFYGFHFARNSWVLSTTRDFLASLGDDEVGNKYLQIFTLMTPVSILGLPFVDIALAKYGFGAGLAVVSALGLLQGIVQVSSDNLNVQIIGFLFFSFYRSFLFSVTFSSLPAFLADQVVGKGYGCLAFVAGAISFINIPLANAVTTSLEGNFFVPNLVYTVLCVPCAYLAWRVHTGFKREDITRRRNKLCCVYH